VLITRLKVVPFIVTLGTMLIVRGAAKGLADERRIEAPATWLNGLLRTVRGAARPRPAPRDLDPAVLALLVAGVLRYTVFGRHLFAIGSNERTARLCGVRVERVKVAVYTISAALAGVAGVMQFAKLSVGDPTVRGGPRAGRDRGRHHRRGQPHRRQRHRARHRAGGDHHVRGGDRLLAARARELGAADRDRRDHRAGGGSRPLAAGITAGPRV
jgi:hypothetical protein